MHALKAFQEALDSLLNLVSLKNTSLLLLELLCHDTGSMQMKFSLPHFYPMPFSQPDVRFLWSHELLYSIACR